MDLVHDRAIIVAEEDKNVAEEDRISKLSDKIIHRILSLLDLKDAIRTSKISRRWRHIWAKMPHLDLNYSNFRDMRQFAKFVKHVLSHRSNSALVSSVNLTFKGEPTQFVVKSIINYSLSHNVKKLTMTWEYHGGKCLEFPRCLFSSHTLKVLTLTGSYNATCFIPESGWDFPSLETLNLTNIYISGVTDKSPNPFSKCVNLKNLNLDRLRMHRESIFIIDAPQLSNLTITNAFGFPEGIHVVAPQLQNLTTSITFSGYGNSKLQLLTEGFNSLEKVELSACSSPYQKNYSVPLALLLDMFQKVCSATVLILDKKIIEAISSHLDELSHEPCPFNNLKCLKVHGVSCYPTRAKNYLLENSPSATFIMDSPQVSQKRSREPVLVDGMANMVAKLEAENKQAEITTDEEKRTLKANIPTHGEVIETQLGNVTDSKRVHSNNILIQADVLNTDTAPTPVLSPSSVNDGDTFVDETQYKQVDGNLEDDIEEVETVEPISIESGQLKRKQATQKVPLEIESTGCRPHTMDLVHDRAIIVAEEDRIVTEEDKISKLSDEIIHRILSFIDMKYAVRTSKISRRWRHIWTTMPHLNLNCSKFRDMHQFAKVVKHVLSHRNNSALVSSVNLVFRGAPTHFAVKSIIKYAFSHDVKKLNLRCCASKCVEFPLCFFSSTTLKFLTLTLTPTHDSARCSLPESGWDFPSLETLNLRNIYFTGDRDKSLNPFSKCVNLKNLTLDGVCLVQMWIFIIYAPQLSNLRITNTSGVINVVAPQLQNLTASLNVRNYPHSKLYLLTEGFNSLEKVKLSSFLNPYQEIDVPWLLDMFHIFCRATVLILDRNIIEVHGVSCYPTRAKNYLLENSPSATFIMDSPQVPQKRSREPVPNDGMTNKVAKLEAENKQAETTDKEKRTLKAKIPTQGEVIAELCANTQIPETTKSLYEKLMPLIIKGKVAELNLQVESGNPDYEVIRSMGCEIKSLIDLIPKFSMVAMRAHFSTWYKDMKQRSHTYIQIWSDILTTDTAPMPSSSNVSLSLL